MDDSTSIGSAVVTADAAVLVALLLFAGLVLATWFSHISKERELRLRMVELAVDILREDPKDANWAKLRGWVVRVIQNSSPVKLTPEEENALKEIRLAAVGTATGTSEVGATRCGLAMWTKRSRIPRKDAASRAAVILLAIPPYAGRRTQPEDSACDPSSI